jgi:antitoxin PrlF
MDKHIPKTKTAESLFARPEGATMDEVIAATGGYQYNVLRRLEAKGYKVRKTREGSGTRYFAQPPVNPSYDLTVSARGQVVLPKDLRERLGVTAGGKLEARLEEGRVTIHPKTRGIAELIGMLHRPGMRPLSLEEIDSAIAESAVARASGPRARKP